MVHPLAFVLRRVLYSIIIVFMVGDKVFFGALLLLLNCLFMLCFLASEAQWEDSLINRQHFFNEVVLYLVFAALMCFSGLLTTVNESVSLGWLVIAIILTMIIYNASVILFDLCMYIKLLVLRYRHKIPLLKPNKTTKALKSKVIMGRKRKSGLVRVTPKSLDHNDLLTRKPKVTEFLNSI